MVRIRSAFDVVSRLALAYAVAFQALFGVLVAPAFARALDHSLNLCARGEGTSGTPLGDHIPADHCAVMCQIGGGPGTQLTPPQAALNLAPVNGRGEPLGPAIVALPDGARDHTPNARGPPQLG